MTRYWAGLSHQKLQSKECKRVKDVKCSMGDDVQPVVASCNRRLVCRLRHVHYTNGSANEITADRPFQSM